MKMTPICTFIFLSLLPELAHLASTSQQVALCGETMIPAIEWMENGIDVTALVLTPVNGRVDKRGFLNPLFNWTCNLNQTWAHKSNLNQGYSVPDQVSIETLDFGAFNTTVSLSRTVSQYRDTQTAGITFSGDETSRKYLFSADSKFRQTILQMYHGNKTIAETSGSGFIFKATLNQSGQLTLRNDFKSSLPLNLTNVPKYEDSPEMYDSFVAKFGTHFFASATFGRKLSVKLVVNQAFTKKSTEEDLLKKLAANFIRSLYNSTDGFVMDPLLEPNCEILSNGFTKPWHLTEWRRQVIRNPFLLFGTLKPIHELISIPAFKTEVAKAVSLKMAKAYLAQLVHLVKKGGLELSANDTAVISHAESMLHPHNCKCIPELVEQLDAVFTRLVSPPELRSFQIVNEKKIPLHIAILLGIGVLAISAGFALKGYFIVQTCLTQKAK